MKDLHWTAKLPAEAGLYWIKSPDGTIATFEYTPGVVWQPGFQFSGPITPPGHQSGTAPAPKYPHLTSTGFVRTVRGRIKEKQTT